MPRIRVILALEPSLVRGSVRGAIESSGDITVVGEADTPVHLLLDIQRHEADAVVLHLENDNQIPGICSHLLQQYPELLVVALSREDDRAFLLRQEVSEQNLDSTSIGDLLAALRTANTSYWSRA
ncbi:MAG: response regulator [Planctomycetota bacterium]